MFRKSPWSWIPLLWTPFWPLLNFAFAVEPVQANQTKQWPNSLMFLSFVFLKTTRKSTEKQGYPLTQNYYLQKVILKSFFSKITNFTRNFWKKSFFPGDFEGANSLKNCEKNSWGNYFRNNFVSEGILSLPNPENPWDRREKRSKKQGLPWKGTNLSCAPSLSLSIFSLVHYMEVALPPTAGALSAHVIATGLMPHFAARQNNQERKRHININKFFPVTARVGGVSPDRVAGGLPTGGQGSRVYVLCAEPQGT